MHTHGYRVRAVMGAFLLCTHLLCANEPQQASWRTRTVAFAKKLGVELAHVGAIVGLCAGAGALYGLAHDQIAARAMPNHFSNGLALDSLCFGITAGLGLAAISRIGTFQANYRNHGSKTDNKLNSRKLLRGVSIVAGLTAVTSVIAALCGYRSGARQAACVAIPASLLLMATSIFHRVHRKQKKLSSMNIQVTELNLF